MDATTISFFYLWSNLLPIGDGFPNIYLVHVSCKPSSAITRQAKICLLVLNFLFMFPNSFFFAWNFGDMQDKLWVSQDASKPFSAMTRQAKICFICIKLPVMFSNSNFICMELQKHAGQEDRKWVSQTQRLLY